MLTLLHTHKSEHGTHKYLFYTRFTPEITTVKLQPQAIKHLLDQLGLLKLQSLELRQYINRTMPDFKQLDLKKLLEILALTNARQRIYNGK